MKAFVTGGTGFLGAHVVRQLLRRGARVLVLARKSSQLANLRGLDVTIVPGDILDAGPWENALDGCDALFHVAADYRLWVPVPQSMFQSNVEGTRQTLEAAIRHRVPRIVHTSTVGALAYPPPGQVSNESSEPADADLIGPYKQSKRQAELIARRLAADGHPIVIVNPSTPIGPLDIKPTPTGKMLVDFLNGRMPGYVDTGLNLIDVRDCAEGHLLAAERGTPGQRYILGHRNMTLREILEIAARTSGRKPPRFRIPYPVAYAYAVLDTFLSDHVTRRPPRAPKVGVQLARHFMYFDASKAVRDLGLPQNPIENALADAIQWFSQNGYIAG
ncbi:MAG: NAD-dependent epimerase/dehydratase family protein [Planctomycetes bacterium]|nr:NAD-dependent epimerase/dehydratase family protein [Planctomycetota bacterium]